MSSIRVAIGPWHDEPAEELLEMSGFRVVPPGSGDYETLLWLDRQPGVVQDYILGTPSLRVVQAAETGQEKWETLMGDYPEVQFYFAGNAYSREVAEHGVALILSLMKSLDVAVKRHYWDRVEARDVAGCKALIFGFGGIGQYLSTFLTAMGVQCYGVSSQRVHFPAGDSVACSSGSTDELRASTGIESWDIIANCLPLTPGTRQLFTLERFRQLCRGSIFINIGRGGTVDQEALLMAMDDGLVHAAGLDVTEPEPLPDGHPLWGRERVLISSHSGNPVASRSARLTRVAVQNLKMHFRLENV